LKFISFWVEKTMLGKGRVAMDSASFTIVFKHEMSVLQDSETG